MLVPGNKLGLTSRLPGKRFSLHRAQVLQQRLNDNCVLPLAGALSRVRQLSLQLLAHSKTGGHGGHTASVTQLCCDSIHVFQAQALDRMVAFDRDPGLENPVNRRFREFLSSCRRGGFLVCRLIAEGSGAPAASGTKLSRPAVFGMSGRSVQQFYVISLSSPSAHRRSEEHTSELQSLRHL